MKITWSPESRRQTSDIWHYIAIDDPNAANRMVARLAAAVEKLRHFPYLGRPGRKGSRELEVSGTPFIVVYRVEKQEVKIGTILHGAQRNSE
jgi:toxin ParE1/3/4